MKGRSTKTEIPKACIDLLTRAHLLYLKVNGSKVAEMATGESCGAKENKKATIILEAGKTPSSMA